ncbi:MAG: nucleotidyl transferase AbiEii/AbiGii toxin family protein [Clostridia bacterium]
MIKNAKSLMDKFRNLAASCNITVNEVLQNYMFERILERLSVSKYKNNFILKGGLLLSSIMGIDTRTTMDMDTCIKGIELTDEQLYEALQEILNIDINDGAKFEIRNFQPIREEDDYGGLKYNLLAIFDNLRVNLSIDIATGDLITPREIEYDYKMIFENRNLKIMTYNIESIIAEKFQTVINRGILNSRMKDYYDLYYLITYKEFSKENLKNAIIKTFNKRDTDIKNINKVIDEIEKSEFVKELWTSYSEKYQYAKCLEFKKVINSIKRIEKIFL